MFIEMFIVIINYLHTYFMPHAWEMSINDDIIQISECMAVDVLRRKWCKWTDFEGVYMSDNTLDKWHLLIVIINDTTFNFSL